MFAASLAVINPAQADWDPNWDYATLPSDAAANSQVAAVSRIPTSMEVWWISGNGAVKGAYWYESDYQWHEYTLAPSGSAAVTGGIAAVSRIPNSMEVYWIKPNGSVQHAYWYGGSNGNGKCSIPGWTGWSCAQLAPPGSASTYNGIAAVSRIPGHLEVWWAGYDGSLQDAHYYDGMGGNGKCSDRNWTCVELVPPGEGPAYGSRLAAVSRSQISMDVFWISPYLSVEHAQWYWDAGNSQCSVPASSGWSCTRLGPAYSAAGYGGIAAVARIPYDEQSGTGGNTMEVWWIGNRTGSVQHAYWYDGTGGNGRCSDPNWTCSQFVPGGSASLYSGIAAVSRMENTMEVWWTGRDGSVQHAYWYDGSGGNGWCSDGSWNCAAFTPTAKASVDSGIASVSRALGTMEVWWIGSDGSLADAHYYARQFDFDWNPIVFDNGVPVGGYSHLTIREDGTYTVSSYLQCNAWGIFSGFVNFDTSLVWAVDDMSNFVFTLSHSGHVCPDNDGWYLDEQNDDLRRNWPSIAARSYAVVQASVNLKVWDLIGKILEYIGTAVGIVSGTEEITKKKDSRGGNGNTM